MTLHEDVARIKHGDTVVAEFRHYGEQFEVKGPALKIGSDLKLGPFTLAYEAGADLPGISASLLRVIDHQPAPTPLYANRPDITQPRPYDVVAAEDYPGGELMPITFWNGLWRAHAGSRWTTEELLIVGPLTLLATAQP